jgi:hypothetical protein
MTRNYLDTVSYDISLYIQEQRDQGYEVEAIEIPFELYQEMCDEERVRGIREIDGVKVNVI